MGQKYTLITGASAGLGKELAVAAARRGFNLLLVALPGTELAELATIIQEKHNVTVKYLEVDLSGPVAAKEVYLWCTQRGYEVDKLINNVGMGGSKPFENFTLSEMQVMIQLNIGVMVSMTNVFMPMLRKQRKAHILNVSSTASFFNIPNKSVYSATKAFVNTLTTSLRNELKGTAIAVSILCPGGSRHKRDAVVEKKMSKGLSNFIHETPERIAEAGVRGMLRSKRMILPGLVAKLYVYTSRILPPVFSDFLVRKLFRTPGKKQVTYVPKQDVLVRRPATIK